MMSAKRKRKEKETIIIIKRISRAAIYHARRQHRAL